ncbi:MAG: YihY/virulence factor BrkB family protein [Clostridia bacterium]|nr:YihY/virulence factor BrkB family protein [Clostridia bacterium]
MIEKNGKKIWYIAKNMVTRYTKHRINREAAEVTYYLLFTMFPLMIFLSSVIRMLGISADSIFERLRVLLPDGVVDIILEYLGFVGGMNKTVLLYGGSILAIYMLYNTVTSLNHAVRKAKNYDTTHKLPRVLISLIISGVMMLLVIGLLLFFSVSGEIYRYIEAMFNLSGWVQILANIIRFAAGPVILFFIIGLYYYVIMRKEGEKLKNFMPGALFAVLLWFAFSLIFVYYVNVWVDFTTIYGSLSSMMVLLIWFHTTASALILGAELNDILLESKLPKDMMASSDSAEDIEKTTD